MKFLADQNVEVPLIERLRAGGHDVTAVREIAPRLTDEQVLELAHSEGRILITNDKDFGDLVYIQGRCTSGVILLRLTAELAEVKADTLSRVIDELGERLDGRFAVVMDDRVRIRQIVRA